MQMYEKALDLSAQVYTEMQDALKGYMMTQQQ
jgi:hypothetical protein